MARKSNLMQVLTFSMPAETQHPVVPFIFIIVWLNKIELLLKKKDRLFVSAAFKWSLFKGG